MSFPKSDQNIVQHFTHIHPLTKIDEFGEFTCDACKTYGYRKTYHCAHCNYNLHDHCATCPPTLSTFMHPQHKLCLVFKEPQETFQSKHMCDICDELVEGLFYQCEACNFDVHPLCLRLPQHVRHVPHPDHPLELSPWGASNTCLVCQDQIRSWRYKCEQCWLDVHMECISANTSAKMGIQERCYGSHSYPHPSQSYQPYYNHGCGYNYGYGHTNHGQYQELRPSKGKRIYALLVSLGDGVVCNMISTSVFEAFGSF